MYNDYNLIKHCIELYCICVSHALPSPTEITTAVHVTSATCCKSIAHPELKDTLYVLMLHLKT